VNACWLFSADQATKAEDDDIKEDICIRQCGGWTGRRHWASKAGGASEE